MVYRAEVLERMARAINKASFAYHDGHHAEEERLWRDCRPLRLVQAEYALAALVADDRVAAVGEQKAVTK